MTIPQPVVAAVQDLTEARGGHLIWTGRVERDHPVVKVDRVVYRARRVLFEHHHGRPPVGAARRICDEPACIAPEHARDRSDAATRGPRYKQGRVIPGEVPTAALWAFRDRLHRTPDGHRLWQGPTDHGRTAILIHDGYRYPAIQVAWVEHYGTAPEGQVQPECGRRLCLEATHLSDAAVRRSEQQLRAAVYGISLDGACDAGHPRISSIVIRPRKDGKVDVICRPCENAYARARRAANRPTPNHLEGAAAA